MKVYINGFLERAEEKEKGLTRNNFHCFKEKRHVSQPAVNRSFEKWIDSAVLGSVKKIATDRGYVFVLVKITIPVEKKWFGNNPKSEENFRQIRGLLGELIIFHQKRERQIISGDQKDQLAKEICSNAMETGLKYLGKDNFAAKYILKTFTDQQYHRNR